MPQTFLPIFPNDASPIKETVGFARRDDMVFYFLGSIPIYSHHVNNLKSFRLITAQLVVNGNATQMEIVRAFGISKISMASMGRGCTRPEDRIAASFGASCAEIISFSNHFAMPFSILGLALSRISRALTVLTILLRICYADHAVDL